MVITKKKINKNILQVDREEFKNLLWINWKKSILLKFGVYSMNLFNLSTCFI